MSDLPKPIILFEGLYEPGNTRVRVTLVSSKWLTRDIPSLGRVIVETPIEGICDVMGQVSWQRCHANWALDIKIDALATYICQRVIAPAAAD